MAGENPTRRYKWFRPRQAYRGAITLSGPVNNATLLLNNNSTGPLIIVVRDFLVVTTAAHLIAVAAFNGTLGSSGGTITPMISGEAQGPGVLYSVDDSTTRIADYYVAAQLNQPQWRHDFPFQILQPGQSVLFQDTTGAETMRLAILWEAIYSDELDWA